MADIKESIMNIMDIDGAQAVVVIDAGKGMLLGAEGGEQLDLEFLAANYMALYRANLKILEELHIQEVPEDFLMTFPTQYHLMMVHERQSDLLVYAIFGNSTGAVALSRRKMRDAMRQMDFV